MKVHNSLLSAYIVLVLSSTDMHEMQFFDGRNYRINKVLLLCIGQWPYQTSKSSSAIIVIIVSLAGTQFVAKICGLFSIDDIDVFIDSLSPLVVDIGCGVKLITCILKAPEIRALFDQIQSDWQSLMTSTKIKILDTYAQNGRKFTIIYATIATDTMYVIMVQHVCGLFTIIGQEMENIIKKDNKDSLQINLYPTVQDDKPYENIIKSIYAHKRVLRFANLIETAFNQMFLVLAGFNMLIMSMTGVTAVTNVDKPEEFLRQITFACALLVHLFFESFQAQRLIDHSAHIYIRLLNEYSMVSDLNSDKKNLTLHDNEDARTMCVNGRKNVRYIHGYFLYDCTYVGVIFHDATFNAVTNLRRYYASCHRRIRNFS
ncbi:uncharacterized protein LOC105284937 isoform X4 [Ooceraea biroi]|uniref:uncharacterized protein LOC105284937 isoform X4 n=1 Tax=Ooceraea biroi TaxID=2015173 RepID=UPI0005BD28C4|nr:uncharacterized protein LOC105284937 isoform X4 [Ooceraea biroi]